MRMSRSTLALTAWPIILLVLASFVYVGVKSPQHNQFSPYDEFVYLDYLSKVPSQLIVRQNEETGNLARDEISCRGVLNYGDFGERCHLGKHSNDALYPYAGHTGADIYTPVFFVVTWVIAQPLVWSGVSLLDAGRLVGGVWLAGGLVTLYLLMSALRVPRRLSIGLCLLVLASPGTYWATTYLSTDAPALLVGAGLGLAAVAVARVTISAWWLVPLAVFAVLLKVQSLASLAIVVGALIAYQAWRQFHGTGSPPLGIKRIAGAIIRDRIILVASSSFVIAVLAQAVWLGVRALLALPANGRASVAVEARAITPSALVDETFKFLLHAGFADIPAGAAAMVAGYLLSIATVLGVFGLVFAGSKMRPVQTVIGCTTLAVALVMGPALALASHAVAGYYFALPFRYGLVLLPAFVVCAALFLCRNSRISWLAGIGGALVAFAAIVS